MDNLLWIKYAGLGLFCDSLTQPALPLIGNVNAGSFRVYLSDTGLLTHFYGQPAREAILTGDMRYNYGTLAENQIAVCLDQCGYNLYFYRKNNGPGKMELDFVIETSKGLTVIEVKSGRSRDAPSIHKADRFFKVDVKVMFENGQYRKDEEEIEHFPLYAAAFFDRLWNGYLT